MNFPIHRTGLSAALMLAATVSLQALAAPTPLPPLRTVGVASYTSGGVGEAQAARFKAAFDQFPLAIELLEHVGAHDQYTADARVKIVDHRGQTVLDERAQGPFMLVRLPAGEYRVMAWLNGHALPAHEVHVTARDHLRTAFVWSPNAG